MQYCKCGNELLPHKRKWCSDACQRKNYNTLNKLKKNNMSQGPHIHDWHYNNAETSLNVNGGHRRYYTMRYCKTCRFIEEVELTIEKPHEQRG